MYRIFLLTKRQKELAKLVVQGKTSKVIAYELGLTHGTVKEYLARMYKKVGLSNRAEFINWAKCSMFCPRLSSESSAVQREGEDDEQ